MPISVPESVSEFSWIAALALSKAGSAIVWLAAAVGSCALADCSPTAEDVGTSDDKGTPAAESRSADAEAAVEAGPAEDE
ncbi:hypothetical protein L0N33_20810, partial [Roseburia faecis]|nr:hypothetical protein [Roseburia faecis]